VLCMVVEAVAALPIRLPVGVYGKPTSTPLPSQAQHDD
jgi:hypothetical protein